MFNTSYIYISLMLSFPPLKFLVDFVNIFTAIDLKLRFINLPRKFVTNSLKVLQSSFSLKSILLSNTSSLKSSRISGSTKTPSSISAFSSPGNLLHRYLNHSRTFDRALTNCFIKPSLIWSRGNRTLLGSTKLSFTFLFPGFNAFLRSHSVLFQWFFLSRLFHSHKKKGYLVYLACWTRNMESTFKSLHIVHHVLYI